jgi:hypothetical protein
MEDRIRFVAHKGQQILLIDFSHCEPKQLLRIVDEVQEEVSDHPRNSVLTLADFTGAQIDKAVATRMKEALAMDRPHVKRSAWVGTESLPKVFYENFRTFSRRDFPTFQTREEAMDWLVKE